MIVDTIGMTPSTYEKALEDWVRSGTTIYMIAERIKCLERIEKPSFSITKCREAYELSFVAGSDIYECMWVCTQLYHIFGAPIRTALNGVTITWRQT